MQAEPREVYGQYDTLLSLYNADHRIDLSEPTTAKVLKDLLERRGYAVRDEAIQEALRAMYAVTQANWYLEAEAVPLVQELKLREFQIGVISNAADEENTQALIDKGGIRPYLGLVLSSAAFGKRKPDPGIFRAALDHFGIPAGRTVMAGDTYAADIVGGKGAGLRTIWLPRNSQAAVGLAHPEADVVAGGLLDIPAMISH